MTTTHPTQPAPTADSTGRPPRASEITLADVMDRIDVTAAELRRQIDTIAGALNDGAPGWSQAMAATNARLRSQLAEAREQRDHAQRWNDEARRAWAVDSAELAVVRGELAAAREAYQRLAEAAQTVADALDAVATGGILDSAGHLRDMLSRALTAAAPETGPRATQAAEPAPAQAEASTDHLGDADGAVAYWRAEISEILAAWLGEEQRTGWQRLASDVAEQIILDLDIADMAAQRDRLRTEAAMLRAEREWLADRARTMGIAEAIIAAHGPAHAVSAEAGRLRAEVKRLSARVREWEAVNSDLAERCDSGDIPIRLGERYSQAVLREIDRLRAELEMAEQDRDLARQAAENRQRERDEARAALATAERERDALRTQLRRALDELGTTSIPTDEGVRWLAESLLGAREKLAAVAEIADNLEKAEVGSVMTYGDARGIAATLRAALGATPDTGSTHG